MGRCYLRDNGSPRKGGQEVDNFFGRILTVIGPAEDALRILGQALARYTENYCDCYNHGYRNQRTLHRLLLQDRRHGRGRASRLYFNSLHLHPFVPVVHLPVAATCKAVKTLRFSNLEHNPVL